MKLYNIAILGTLAAVMLTGCEMKEELWPDKDKDGNSLGKAVLKVSVKKPLAQTRADVPTGDFPVQIVGKSEEVENIQRNYDKVSEITSAIQLPVGTYEVISHSPGEIEKQMTVPYYEGKNENVIIQYKITTQVDVICKQKNSHIQVVYGDDFKENFSSWTITVDDEQDKTLTFSSEDQENTGTYWYFGEDLVTAITVNVRGTTTEGNSVSESRTFKKANATEGYDDVNEFFEGGDAITIQMGAVQASSGHITGVTINADVIFDDHSETVEIPAYDETTQTITITDNNTGYLQNGVNVTPKSAPSDVSLLVNAPEGIKNLYVKIASDNSTFATVLTSVNSGISTGDGIDFVSTKFPLGDFAQPTSDSKSYTFSLAGIMGMLQLYQGTHTFTLKVVDNENQTKTATLRVISAEEEGGGNEGGSDSNMPTLQMPADFSCTAYDATTAPSEATAIIHAPEGLSLVKVKINSTDSGFLGAIEELNLDDFDLIENESVNTLLEPLGKTSPQRGQTEAYEFPIHAFFSLLVNFPGTHSFTITVTDANGKSVGPETLTINVIDEE